MANPFLMGLLPIVSRSVLFIAHSLNVILSQRLPSLHGRLRGRLQQITSNGKQIWSYNAMLEVATGMALLVQLFLPIRNILLTLMFWQYLRLRYMVSADSRFAFGRLKSFLDQKILGPTSYCPRFVGNLYTKLCSFISSMTDMTQQQQRPSCTIS